MSEPIYVTEFKPRKAKYGFRTTLRGDSLFKVTDELRHILGPSDPARYFLEISTSGNGPSCTLNIYVDDDSLTAPLRAMVDAFAAYALSQSKMPYRIR